MKTFENTILVTEDLSATECIKEMNKFGADGWEVTSVICDEGYKYFILFFKRELE